MVDIMRRLSLSLSFSTFSLGLMVTAIDVLENGANVKHLLIFMRYSIHALEQHHNIYPNST